MLHWRNPPLLCSSSNTCRALTTLHFTTWRHETGFGGVTDAFFVWVWIEELEIGDIGGIDKEKAKVQVEDVVIMRWGKPLSFYTREYRFS
jgi:hypothetical protein